MRLQVLVDGVDKGEVDLAGAGLGPYADLLGAFNQLVADIYRSENPEGPDRLDIRSNVSLRRPRRTRRAS